MKDHKQVNVFWISTSRKVKLKDWIDVDRRKPRKNQRVSICDSDWQGFADYEFAAIYDGSYFMVDGGRIDGATYWKPIKMKELKSLRRRGFKV